MEKKKRVLGLVLSCLLLLTTMNGCGFNKTVSKGLTLYTRDAYTYEKDIVYAVYASKADSYKMKVIGDAESIMSITVNGQQGNCSQNDKDYSIKLNKGINSVELKLKDEVEDVVTTVEGINIPLLEPNKDAGASINYDLYEAEEGETNATIAKESRVYRSFASEASNRSYVELKNTDEDISIILQNPANALVIRYCIPDSEDGKGLTTKAGLYLGEDYQEIELTSKYSWVYGAYPWNNDPSTKATGGGHRFFDDVRIKLDKTYQKGTKITIRKEDFTDVDYLLVDLIEAEAVDEPIPQGENALNVLDYGAFPNDGEDDADAIMECVKEALEQGKEVYIPEGQFEIGNPFYVYGLTIKKDNVVIRGAGMWHTILHGEAAGFSIRAGHVILSDFSLVGEVTSRRNSIDPCALDLTLPLPTLKDIRFQNLWIEHYKVGLWADVTKGISMMGCRIRNTFADGVNLCGGTNSSVITQNDIRNTGDDGIAMFSRGVPDKDIKITYNTVALPWLANNIALYGGKDIEVSHNLLLDTITNGGGINISTNFTPQVFEGTILVEENTLIRTGSAEWNLKYGGIWMNTVEGYDNLGECIIRNNRIQDSTYHGISFHNSGLLENMVIENNEIDKCAEDGIFISGETKGSFKTDKNRFKEVGHIEINNLSNNMQIN